MRLAWAVALVAAMGTTGPLDEARAAFDRQEYARAEALALAEAHPPREGAALYLVGLARFRDGRPADALAALELAGRAQDPPPVGPWHFNRAACLYELGRFDEAEEEYLAAAALDPELAPVSLANAGFAALDRGALDRARAHLAKARPIAAGRTAELVSELDAQLSRPPGERGLGEGDRPLGAGTSSRTGWGALLRVEGGWDSNALQLLALSEDDRAEEGGGLATSSALTLVGAGVAIRREVGESATLDLAYGFGQLAYLESAAADRSIQLHGIEAGLEVSLGDGLRAGGALEGQLAFTGLSAFRGMLAAGGARAFGALDETARTTTRLELSWFTKASLRQEFAYLSGNRFEGTLSQELRLRPVVLSISGRLALDRIGAARTSMALPEEVKDCLGCAQELVEPFGYAATALFASARASPARWLELALSFGMEGRNYLEDDALFLRRADGSAQELERRQRHDLRLFAGEVVTLRVTQSFSILLRHDLVVDRSNLDGTASEEDEGACGIPEMRCQLRAVNHAFNKNVVTVGTQLAW